MILSSEHTSRGNNALRLDYDPAKGYGKTFVDLNNLHEDWYNINRAKFTLDLYNAGSATFASIAVSTGDDLTWHESLTQPLHYGWNKIMVDVSSETWKSQRTNWTYTGDIANLDQLRKISVGIFGYTTTGSIYVDNMHIFYDDGFVVYPGDMLGATIMLHACKMAGITLGTKTVTPTGQVNYGDELTYTLVFSAAPDIQVGLYDPLEGTTFITFTERPTGVTQTNGVITGALTLTPTRPITVSFVAQASIPITAGWTVSVANHACLYPWSSTLGGCLWTNNVTKPVFRPYEKVYLPLIVKPWPPLCVTPSSFLVREDEFFLDTRNGAIPSIPPVNGVDLNNYILAMAFHGGTGGQAQLYFKNSSWENVYSTWKGIADAPPLRFDPIYDPCDVCDFRDFSHIYAIGARIRNGTQGVTITSACLIRR
jgi:hypothetical protein